MLSLAAQCLVSAPVCLSVCLFVRLTSDHLQLIKFWPSCIPGKGVYGGANFFGSVLLQPASSVCFASERFFHYYCCAGVQVF